MMHTALKLLAAQLLRNSESRYLTVDSISVFMVANVTMNVRNKIDRQTFV